MIDPTIIVALISLTGTLIGSLVGILVSAKLTAYRLEQLEKMYPEHYTAARKQALKALPDGYYGIDCVGLIKSYYWGDNVINTNIGGTVKTLIRVSSQPIAGTIKDFSTIHAYVGGTLKKLFPDEKPAYMFQISDTNGGGIAGNTKSTTTLSDWQTAEIGYRYHYANTVSATGSSGVPNIRLIPKRRHFTLRKTAA